MAHIIIDFDSNKAIEEDGDVDERFSPCSSFKIPIALMGYDSGILTHESSPILEYKPEYDPHCLMMLDNWKQPYTPQMWMKHSCVWYSQYITNSLGMKQFQSYIDSFEYGNRDLSGGILRAWLTTSLTISPREQTDFLFRMLAGKLPVSSHAVTITKKLVASGNCAEGKLFGKTGSGYIDIERGLQRGWYTGWLEKNGRKYLFAALRDHSGPGYAGLQVKEFMRKTLERLLSESPKNP